MPDEQIRQTLVLIPDLLHQTTVATNLRPRPGSLLKRPANSRLRPRARHPPRQPRRHQPVRPQRIRGRQRADRHYGAAGIAGPGKACHRASACGSVAGRVVVAALSGILACNAGAIRRTQGDAGGAEAADQIGDRPQIHGVNQSLFLVALQHHVVRRPQTLDRGRSSVNERGYRRRQIRVALSAVSLSAVANAQDAHGLAVVVEADALVSRRRGGRCPHRHPPCRKARPRSIRSPKQRRSAGRANDRENSCLTQMIPDGNRGVAARRSFGSARALAEDGLARQALGWSLASFKHRRGDRTGRHPRGGPARP